jgi:hypothetical protein
LKETAIVSPAGLGAKAVPPSRNAEVVGDIERTGCPRSSTRVPLSRRRHPGTLVRLVVAARPPKRGSIVPYRLGTEIADVQDQQVGRRCRDMRAVALYMLGVPVFLIVILWLFGVV